MQSVMHWRKRKGLSRPCPSPMLPLLLLPSLMSPPPLLIVEPGCETPPATSPCADVNVGRARAHRAEDKSDKRDKRYTPLKLGQAALDSRTVRRDRRRCELNS
jgi:hypothetical protein